SPLVVPDGTRHYAEEHGVENPVYVYIPNARPGARSPHCWVATAAEPTTRLAIHDLFGSGFVLLTHGGRGVAWARAVDGLGRLGATRHYHVGAPGSRADLLDVDDVWTRCYGIAEDGAVLVRPDGHVCWRAFDAPEADGGVGLPQALDVAVGRS